MGRTAWRVKTAVRRAGKPLYGFLQRRWFPQLADEQWLRVEMNRRVEAFLRDLDVAHSDAVEISGSRYEALPWRSYEALHWPEFDLCRPPPVAARFDVVICEQVLEHVVDPWAATRTLFELCRPGGRLVVNTPFLVRLHDHPGDYWRFAPDGLRLLLEHAGWQDVVVDAWGNEACLRANLRRWAPVRPWSSMRNERDLPLVVWAFARRAGDQETGSD